MADRLGWLDEAFGRMGQAAQPHIRPPGVGAAQRVVRRRRVRRFQAAAAAAFCVLLAGTFRITSGGPEPVTPPASPPSASPSASPSVSPSVQPSAAVAPPTVTSSSRPGGPLETLPSCAKVGPVAIQPGNEAGTFIARLATNGPVWSLMCPDGKAPFFWATYTVDADGTHHLYRSQRYELTYAVAEMLVRFELPPLYTCTGWAFYVVIGNVPIETTVPRALDAGSSISPPYPGRKQFWDVRYGCASPSS